VALKPTTLITEDTIQGRVAELAQRISKDYATVSELYLVGVLKGAFIFLADLSRLLAVPRRVDFIALSSYERTTTEPTGAVRLIMDVRAPLQGKHVLVVEDIVDTGYTLSYLLKILTAREPASLKTCVLLRKKDRLRVSVPIDYLGFDIPDVWVVGYGLDYADQFRTLPFIGAITPEAEE
jgi:hypoxanthine phosphoribosyltransferase